MPTYTKLLWTLLLVGVCAPSLVVGDTFLTHPVSYSRADLTNRGCKNTGKNPSFDCSGPCDVRSPTDQTPPTVVQRGEDLRVSWVKNGHKGGFVRMSLLKRNEDQSDVLTQDRFDANAEKTVCFEPYLSCELSSSMTYSGAEGVALNSYNCSTSLNIRQQLQDGLYTLQWIWFGGISSGDHYSCSDIRVSGGPTLEFSTIRFPEWQGGDVYYPGEPRCNYYNARKRGMCIYDQPCTNNTDVNDPYRFLGTDEWRANAPDEGQYDELDPIPLQSPAQTQTPTPIPVNTDDSKKSSDDAVTVALGVGLPAIAAAMVLGAVLWVKKHPVPTQPATAASVGYSMNMLSATPPNEYTRDHRLRLSSGTNLASSANLV